MVNSCRGPGKLGLSEVKCFMLGIRRKKKIIGDLPNLSRFAVQNYPRKRDGLRERKNLDTISAFRK